MPTFTEAAGFLVAAALVASSAIFVKEQSAAPPLVAVDATPASYEQAPAEKVALVAATSERSAEQAPAPALEAVEDPSLTIADDGEPVIRFVKGRKVRAVRTVWMTVTAYSPDARSCGKWADGVTASMKSVWTNGMKLVAADTRLLPFGSLISVPGYDEGRIVPVLDRGGAIKGDRLDVLYPTHEIARRWGVQRLPVTIWEYVDEE